MIHRTMPRETDNLRPSHI